MEEIKNESCPPAQAPEDKPACCCCGGKKKPIAVAAIAVIVIAAVIACLFIFDVFCPSLAKYAPEGTDVIGAVNGKKIAKTKVWAAFKKTAIYEKAAAEAKKDGVDLDKAVQSDVCVFVDVNGKAPRFCVIARSRDGIAEKVFGLFKKDQKKSIENQKKLFEEISKDDPKAKAPTFSEDKIAGKQAFVWATSLESRGAAILLDKNTIQVANADKGEELIAVPLKAKGIALAKAVDPKALISIAYKFELPDDVKKFVESEDGKFFKDLANELKTVTLNVYDRGSDLEVKLVAEYGSAASAKKAEETLITLRKAGKENIPDKKALEAIDGIKIAVSGKKVTASLKYSQSKLVEFIEEWNKGEQK